MRRASQPGRPSSTHEERGRSIRAATWSELRARVFAHARQRPAAIAFEGASEAPVSRATLMRRIVAIEERVEAMGLEGSCALLSGLSPGWTAALVVGLISRGVGVCLVDSRAAAIGVREAAEAIDASVVVLADGRVKDAPLARSVQSFLDGAPIRPKRGVLGGHVMLRSSGTLSGQPRFARRSADSCAFVGRAVSEHLEFRDIDRIAAIASQSHSYGFEHALLAPLWSGASAVTTEGLHLDRIVSALDGGATHLAGVPALYELLADRDQLNAPKLRIVYSAGAALPVRVAERFEQAHRRRIGQLYGATEFGSVAFCDPRDPHFVHGCAGRPFDGVTITAAPLPDDPLRAELMIDGPSLFAGYVGAESVQRPMHSGDLGRVDESGRIWIEGRLHALIDIGGAKVNPAEIESVLRQHPSVQDCIVVPLTQSSCVQRIRAVVTVVNGAVDVESLRRFARERMPAHMVPRVIDVVDELPRSATGKVLVRQVMSE